MADMDAIMSIASKHDLYVIEDNAQAIGASYSTTTMSGMAGTIGHIGTTSFFPSKNLGCAGDGGALSCNDDVLAATIRMIANHGQKKKYYHSVIGVNSRLDALQAAILNVKLKHLNSYVEKRQWAATQYDDRLQDVSEIDVPSRVSWSDHVFHQYTLKVKGGHRDALQSKLADKGIPSMIYYPVPLYLQEAFQQYYSGEPMSATEELCTSVLSLPIHTEMNLDTIDLICDTVRSYF